MKKNKYLLLITIVLGIVVLTTACEKQKNDAKYDYLVLVNKYSQLPDDWEENVELVSAKNAWDEDVKLEKETYENYKKLEKALKKEDVIIELDSIYRSVQEQQDLWDRWSNDPDKGIEYAKKYAAVPGYSEHHTGLAVDIVIRKNGKLIEENEDMIAEEEIFAKVHEKLADYGFILRYLKDRDSITGYTYEPWHLRYVGSKEIAKEIMDKDITFEEYLASIKDIKGTPEAAKYQIEKALQEYFKDVYGNQIINSRFNVTKIYTSSEEDKTLKSLNLKNKDVAFEVTYQIQPAEGIDPNMLTITDGEYDEELGWVKNISRLGVLRFDSNKDSYLISNFGTGW